MAVPTWITNIFIGILFILNLWMFYSNMDQTRKGMHVPILDYIGNLVCIAVTGAYALGYLK